jgi:hypothetical protein
MTIRPSRGCVLTRCTPHSGISMTTPNLLVRQPDPPIEYGPFRAYRRTDGKIAVVDVRRPFADRTVKLYTSEDAARDAVREPPKTPSARSWGWGGSSCRRPFASLSTRVFSNFEEA